jgi:Tol biopolymer transport system component
MRSFSQFKSQPHRLLSQISLALVVTLGALASCTSGATPSATPSHPGQTSAPTLAPTLEVGPSPSPEKPDTTSTPLLPPAPTLVLRPSPTSQTLDFRALLPTAPPGYGELGNHLIFFSDRSGKHQIFKIALDGSGLDQLTKDLAFDIYDMEPAWSMDGKIAFTSDYVNGFWEVFILDADGGPPVQITDLGADSWSLAWSPDGNSLAFVSDMTGDDEIYLVNLDDDAPVNLTRNPLANDFLPVWSPDGQQIAFVSDREPELDGFQETEQDIYLMASDGSEVTRLTDAEGRDTSPNWSPDGTKIAFVSERDGNFEVYVMNANGSDQIRLTQSGGYEWSPTWSPDGQLIAFTSTRDHRDTYDVYVMAPDGSNQTRLTTDLANDIIPRWWP